VTNKHIWNFAAKTFTKVAVWIPNTQKKNYSEYKCWSLKYIYIYIYSFIQYSV